MIRQRVRPAPAFLGCDPGVSGALAVLAAGAYQVPDLIAILDMPQRLDGAKRRVNASMLAGQLEVIAMMECLTYTGMAIEGVNAMPTDGRSSAFSFGHSTGTIEGIAGALHIPVRRITPYRWRQIMGVRRPPPDAKGVARKKPSTDRAKELWTGQWKEFRLDKRHDHAEAALIGTAGYFMDASGAPHDAN